MPFQKDGLSSWFYLVATFFMTFTIIGLADTAGVFVGVFVDHYKETNAKTGWMDISLRFIYCNITVISESIVLRRMFLCHAIIIREGGLLKLIVTIQFFVSKLDKTGFEYQDQTY